MARPDSRPIDAPHADDAFGQMVWDWYHDQLAETPQYRRDDGQTMEAHLEAYFTDPADWGDLTHEALQSLDGRLLDVGSGPGKHARYLQQQGHDVLAVDRSHGAIAVAREWGVEHAAVMDMRDLDILENTFEGAYALGKQIAIGDSIKDIQETLTTLAQAVEPGGRLVADFDEIERREEGYVDDHLVTDGVAYRTFRVEYDGLVGSWVDLLLVDYDALEGIVSETPWEIVETLGLDADHSQYFVVLERRSE